MEERDLSYKEVARTTLRQMGGVRRLQLMIGASHFVYSDDGTLKFRFDLCERANVVEVSLTPDDLYNVTFKKIDTKTLEELPVKRYPGIFCEDLIPVFETYTKLYLRI